MHQNQRFLTRPPYQQVDTLQGTVSQDFFIFVYHQTAGLHKLNTPWCLIHRKQTFVVSWTPQNPFPWCLGVRDTAKRPFF